MRKRDDFEDDGRTIADMSGIGPAPTLRPHRRKADAPPQEPAKATLAIAGMYLVGLGVLLAVLFLLWK